MITLVSSFKSYGLGHNIVQAFSFSGAKICSVVLPPFPYRNHLPLPYFCMLHSLSMPLVLEPPALILADNLACTAQRSKMPTTEWEFPSILLNLCTTTWVLHRKVDFPPGQKISHRAPLILDKDSAFQLHEGGHLKC